MKGFKKRARLQYLMAAAPVILIMAIVIATSGSFSGSAAATTYSLPPIDPPVPGFFPAPMPGPGSYTEIVTADEVDVLLADNANKGNVHLIDVRSSFEYLADVCPMQIALGLPLYTETNTGHPVWNWPDGTHEEAFSNPYWIGFHWAGTPYASLWNIRMQENPNYHDYLQALVAEGSVDMTDELIFVCQTGYRASWAAKEAAMMGFTNVKVLYGGMLAWEDDWYADDGNYLASGPNPDPSPGDCPTDGPYAGQNCDPDNNPGPGARPKSTVLIDPYQYNTAKLTAAGFGIWWNGTEPHVGVKPEWLAGWGAGDFALSASKGNVYWGSYADYTNGLLSVDFSLTNNAPAPPGPLNYPASCGGAPAPVGSCEQVYQDPHGPAYNSMIVAAPATNGVLASTLPAMVGNVAPNSSGSGTVKFSVPPGVSFFQTNVFAVATDVPDPAIYNDGFHNVVYGQDIAWYGTYTYPGPPPGA
jgi:rhodanese-related sulfurtransferase